MFVYYNYRNKPQQYTCKYFCYVRQGMVGNLRYVFKDAIKYLPLYGYVFGVHGGVFVKRDGTYNERSMKRVLHRLMSR